MTMASRLSAADFMQNWPKQRPDSEPHLTEFGPCHGLQSNMMNPSKSRGMQNSNFIHNVHFRCKTGVGIDW